MFQRVHRKSFHQVACQRESLADFEHWNIALSLELGFEIACAADEVSGIVNAGSDMNLSQENLPVGRLLMRGCAGGVPAVKSRLLPLKA
ncbi:MAG: hypothetical protein COA29_02620 [Porticoccus sp.]|nr:MAG: hypothetical protein COA29_02620 [Porticoccus sp.]